jgi:golgi-specific brefeldin A-resistance guanine nucleotide exchange factor 1
VTNNDSDMPPPALKHLIHALLSQLPEDPSATIISVKSDAAPSVAINGQNRTSDGPVYDPAIVYLLELSTVLALRDDQSQRTVGQEVAEALQNVIRDAANYHHIMVSRTAFYLLRLLHSSYVSF